MSGFAVLFSAQANKDIQKLTPVLKDKAYQLITEIIRGNPYCGKILHGELEGHRSVRLTYQDRIVYRIDKANRVVYIKRARTHYGE